MNPNQVLSVLESLTLKDPLVFVALAVALPLVLFAARSRLRSASTMLRAGILGVRLIVVALLLLAAAQPALRPAGPGRAEAFAIYVSASLAPDRQVCARA